MSVTIHQARDLALRILGLYCVLQLINTVPRAIYLATLIGGQSSPYPGNPITELAGQLGVIAVYLASAIALLFQTDSIIRRIWGAELPVVKTETESETQIPIPVRFFWVRLIGVYFTVRGAAGLASVIWYWLPGFRFEDVRYSAPIGSLLQYAVMLVLAVVCIRRPDAPFRLFRSATASNREVMDS